jgi:hypothetical protein
MFRYARFILPAYLGLILLSCEKDDGDQDNLPLDPFMTAMVDQVSWSADSSITASTGGLSLVLEGNGSNNTQLRITISNYNGTGTYDIPAGSSNDIGRWQSGSDIYSTLIGGSGTIEVTSDNGSQIQGTFSFTANDTDSNTVSIEGGEFVSDI